MKRWVAVAVLVTAACTSPARPPSPVATAPKRVLIFTKTAAFHHSSIPFAAAAVQKIGASHGLIVDVTDDAEKFTASNLAGYQSVVFLLTTGDVLNAAQQRAFESYISLGHGFAGVHSATDTEYGWPFYHQLIGATFNGHPRIQNAVVDVVDASHPSTVGLPRPWRTRDEWYNFRDLRLDRDHVLLNLREKTYAGGTMGADHPIAWCRMFGLSRVWYTGMGHDEASYRDPLFLGHLLGGITWTAGVTDAECRTTA